MNIVTDTVEFEKLLDRFRPSFEPFREVARAFRDTLWKQGGMGLWTLVPEVVEGALPQMAAGARNWLYPGEVRIGVENRQAYLEVKQALEELLDSLQEGARVALVDS